MSTHIPARNLGFERGQNVIGKAVGEVVFMVVGVQEQREFNKTHKRSRLYGRRGRHLKLQIEWRRNCP